MIKTATKSEVVQVAHDLFDPLLEGLHGDIASLRAELAAEGRAREAQDEKMAAAAVESRAEAEKLRTRLTQVSGRIHHWEKMLSEIRQTREQLRAAIHELQVTQANQRDELRRFSAMQKQITAWIADRENAGE